MSTQSCIRAALLSVAVMCAAPVFAAADASMHDVYLAAEAGKFDDAQAMMDKVLRDHPNSGKAHFVEAELLAKRGRLTQAETELASAERLAPGLPFAKPEAVSKLRAVIAGASARAPARRADVQTAPAYAAPAPASGGMPWGWLLGGAGLIAFIVFAMRFMSARNANGPQYGPAGGLNERWGSGATPSYGGGAPGAVPMGGPAGPGFGGASPGIGAGIMGGLATGAALGAGIVAGEALMHHFTDSNGNRSSVPPPYEPPVHNDAPLPNDMGGTDFGVSDSGSWDDSSSSGGDSDWN